MRTSPPPPATKIAKEKVKRRLASLAMSEKIQGKHMREQGLPVRAE